MFKKAIICAGSAILAGTLIFGPVVANAAPVASPAATANVVVAAKKAVKAGVMLKANGKKTVTEKTIKVKPSYKKVGKSKIVSATLTVKQGSKTVARNKASVNLKPGTYKVTQTVKYKVASGKKWGKTKIATKAQSLKIGVVAWESYFAGYQAGQVDAINNYRKSKGLKALTFDLSLAEKAVNYGMMLDWETLDAYPAFNYWSGPALDGYKVKNDDWYAAGKAAGYRKIKGDEFYEGEYSEFLKNGLTRVGVGVYVYWRNDTTRIPFEYEAWLIAR